NTGASNVFAASAQHIPQRILPPGEVAMQVARALTGQGSEAIAGRREGAAAPAPSHDGVANGPRPWAPAEPATTAVEAGWPAPSTPAVAPALGGEGAWTQGGLEPAEGRPPCFLETTIRPDPAQRAVVVRLVAIDPRQVELRLAAGVDEPRSEVGLHG